MTVWPGSVVPVPALLVPQARLVRDCVLVFGTTNEDPLDNPGSHAAELPAEFYLREFLELDARDPKAVLAFCQQWGPVGRQDCSDLPGGPYAGPDAVLADQAMPSPWDDTWARDPERKRKWARRLGIRNVEMVHSVARVAIYQDVLHNMVLQWRYFVGEIEGSDLVRDGRPAHGLIMGFTDDELLALEYPRAGFELVNQLNRALALFHVRLELYLSPHVPLGTPLPNVYQAACLQLANHIAEHASYHTCSNETCGRLFVRQRGGSKIAQKRGPDQGQYHTSGVLYCTPQCARAQAARMVRRRKREATEAARKEEGRI